MSITIGSSGNKTVDVSAHIGNGGNKTIYQGWQGATGNKLIYPTISLSNETIISAGGGTVSATYTLESDGDIIRSLSGSNTDIGDWSTPKNLAPSFYEAFVTPTSGSLSGGATGFWASLGSNQSWVVQQTVIGTKSCTFTIQIRSNGVILTSATITLTAEKIF